MEFRFNWSQLGSGVSEPSQDLECHASRDAPAFAVALSGVVLWYQNASGSVPKSVVNRFEVPTDRFWTHVAYERRHVTAGLTLAPSSVLASVRVSSTRDGGKRYAPSDGVALPIPKRSR